MSIYFNSTSNVEILLVEDNPADAHLIVEVFDGFTVKKHLTIVRMEQKQWII